MGVKFTIHKIKQATVGLLVLALAISSTACGKRDATRTEAVTTTTVSTTAATTSKSLSAPVSSTTSTATAHPTGTITTNTTTATTTTTATASTPREVVITLDNWDEYFEVYEYADWQENAFGEPTQFFGIRCSFNIKNEYADRCEATVACEYRICQSRCDVTYDVKNRTYTVSDSGTYVNEHTATLSGGTSESYIAFSLGDGGITSGTCTVEKYHFLQMTRVEGTLRFYR